MTYPRDVSGGLTSLLIMVLQASLKCLVSLPSYKACELPPASIAMPSLSKVPDARPPHPSSDPLPLHPIPAPPLPSPLPVATFLT